MVKNARKVFSIFVLSHKSKSRLTQGAGRLKKQMNIKLGQRISLCTQATSSTDNSLQNYFNKVHTTCLRVFNLSGNSKLA